MAVRLVVTMRALRGKGAEFAKAFEVNVPAIRQESGCQQYHLFRSVDDPDNFVLLERWTDAAALDEHIRLVRARPAPHAALRDGAPVLERFDVS